MTNNVTREIEIRFGTWMGKRFDPKIHKGDFDKVFIHAKKTYKQVCDNTYKLEYYRNYRVQTNVKTKESKAINKKVVEKTTFEARGSRYDIRYSHCDEVEITHNPKFEPTNVMKKQAIRYDLGEGNFLDLHVYTPEHGRMYFGMEIETPYEFEDERFETVWSKYYELIRVMEPEVTEEKSIISEV